MEMEMSVEMNETVDRLAAAAEMLEGAVSRLAALQNQAIEVQAVGAHELEQKLAVAEARIAELSARASSAGLSFGRKTLQAKESVAAEGLAGGIDAALSSLSMEQRIAVKSQLMRSGLLG